MKRFAEEIETDSLCAYGCGAKAKYVNKSGNLMCNKFANSCPAVKKKNSEKIKQMYDSGRDARKVYEQMPEESKKKMTWNKGILTADFSYGGFGSHKKVLIEERGHKCESCKNETWLGQLITLELEHVDGDKKNNAKENLLLLCPNCHSYTPTWRRPKKKL